MSTNLLLLLRCGAVQLAGMRCGATGWDGGGSAAAAVAVGRRGSDRPPPRRILISWYSRSFIFISPCSSFCEYWFSFFCFVITCYVISVFWEESYNMLYLCVISIFYAYFLFDKMSHPSAFSEIWSMCVHSLETVLEAATHGHLLVTSIGTYIIGLSIWFKAYLMWFNVLLLINISTYWPSDCDA